MDYKKYLQVIGASENKEVSFWVEHNLVNYLKTNPEVQDEIEHILDYLTSTSAPSRLQKTSYLEAKSNAEKWSKTQQKKGEHIS